MARGGNAAGGVPRFTTVTVISAALSIVYANIGRFLVIFLAVGLPAALLIGIVLTGVRISGTRSATGVDVVVNGAPAVQALLLVLASAIALLAYFLIQACITYGGLQSLAGRKAPIGRCLAYGIAALPRVFLAGLILSVLMAAIGMIGVAVYTSLLAGAGEAGTLAGSLALLAVVASVVVRVWVLIPVVVVEQAGPIAAFRRSIALTQGRRWEILAIFALVMLANWLVSVLAQTLPQIGAPAAGGALAVAAALFFSALGTVMAAVGYSFLRAEKEGAAIEDVVRVFD